MTRRNNKIWKRSDIVVLKALYPDYTVREIASFINFSYSAISHKAIELGLKKNKNFRTLENEESVKELYLTHSNMQMAQLIGISKRSVDRIMSRLKLTRSKEVSSRIRSESRRKIMQQETRKVLFGLETFRKIKVVTSRKKISFRHRMKKRGYTCCRAGDIMYYSDETKRDCKLERVGRTLGLSFKENKSEIQTNN